MVGRALRLTVRLLAIGALVALAGLVLGQIYRGSLLPQLVAGAAAGSVLVSLVLRRGPAWLVAPVSMAALFGYGIWAVQVSAAAGQVTGDLSELVRDAGRNAIPRLLTALIPVEPQPDTVLGPVVLAWLAGLAGAELAGRANRPALALIPPTLWYAGALVLVGPNADAPPWTVLAFAGLGVLVLALGERAEARPVGDRGLRLRTSTGLLAGLAAVLALVALVAPMVAGRVVRTPADPRAHVQPPDLDLLDQNPLVRISGWAAQPEQHLFNVEILDDGEASSAPPLSPSGSGSGSAEDDPAEGDGGPAPVAAHDTRLRLAVLSDWDGVTWHVTTEYRNAGRILPAALPPPGTPRSPEAGADRVVRERITVADLNGRLLPAITAPTRVDGVRVAYDRGSGTMLRLEPLRPGVSYEVTSANPPLDLNLLPAADVPGGDTVARYLEIGERVPTDLAELAQKIAGAEGAPYLKALALEQFLAEHYQLVRNAPSGHAYPNLRFFLLGNPNAGGRKGTSEQFAAAYAALGRLLGLPTRVVVGFRTPVGGKVTAGDALAWPEVLFDGVGWVPFNPLPDPKSKPQPIEDDFIAKPPPTTEPPITIEPSKVPPRSTGPTSGPPLAAAPGGPGAVVLAGGIGGGVVLLLVIGALVLALLRSAQSRRRLDRGTPPQRVLGAWREVLDALRLAGSPAPPHLSTTEVATHAADVAGRVRPGVPTLDTLATLVNEVSFAGPTGQAADERSAEAAKLKAVGYADALRSRRNWWRRLLWRIDPRPLRK